MRHFRRFGFIYILILMFFGSWFGQYVAMVNVAGPFKPDEFWAATFENWQSEFLQLFVQALGMYVVADFIFRKADEDMKRIERKIDVLLGERHGK